MRDIDHLCGREIDYFINSNLPNLFEQFGIDQSFLELDPSLWSENENFKKGLTIVRALKVVNDPAERAVCLVEQYNDILTNDENQR